MREYRFLEKKFLEKHKTIDDINYLDKYIKFLINYKIDINETDIYTEKHHILPRSTFPEYEKENWNIVELKYEDHVKAHLFIFKAINIRSYQRPLNWMIGYYKNSEEISKAVKKGWINLKNDKEKYEKWRNNRSNYMKGLTSVEQKRRAKIFWDNITEEQYLIFSNKMKEYWTKEKRYEKSKQMNEYYSNPENILRKVMESKSRWDNMSVEERIKFNQKMNIINKSEEKRRVSGDKIKKLWEDEEYLKKMRNRPHRKGKSILIIKPCGQEILYNTMKEVEKEYGFSSYLIRKYIDKDMEIEDNDLKKNKSLLKCKIKSIKNG